MWCEKTVFVVIDALPTMMGVERMNWITSFLSTRQYPIYFEPNENDAVNVTFIKMVAWREGVGIFIPSTWVYERWRNFKLNSKSSTSFHFSCAIQRAVTLLVAIAKAKHEASFCPLLYAKVTLAQNKSIPQARRQQGIRNGNKRQRWVAIYLLRRLFCLLSV